jgi:hypothetical protein
LTVQAFRRVVADHFRGRVSRRLRLVRRRITQSNQPCRTFLKKGMRYAV